VTRPGGIGRGLAAVGLAMLVGFAPTAAGAAGSATLFPIPASPVQPEPCPPPPLPPSPTGPTTPPPVPAVAESAIPLVGAPGARKVDLSAVSGKGIWITDFPGDKVDARSIVALASADDLQQLFIRTGSSYNGYYGARLLRALVPLAHAAGVDVIAWDFPTMSNPAVDAARAGAAIRDGADGFDADIETGAEGTFDTARRVAYYLSLVRVAIGDHPLVATVPRPIPGLDRHYPYLAEAPFVDVFAPMVYWSCNEPGTATADAMGPLEKLRPVAPIGQDYDMASEGGRHGLPSEQEIWRFLDVARKRGAIGASLYDLELGGAPDLLALARYPWSTRRG
jgi:hypothetical protein